MAGSQTTRLLTPPVSPQNSRLLSPRTPNSSEVQQFAKLRYSSTVEKNEAVLKAGRLSSASTSPNKAAFRRAQDKENSRSPGTSEASPIKGEFSPQAQLDARETVLLAQKLRTAEAALDEERALGDREREVLRDRLRFSESQDEAARDRLAAALASLRAQNSELQDSALQAAEEDKEKEADFQKFRTLQETELQQARDEAKRALQEARQANAERDRLAASLRKCNEDEAAVKEAGRLELTRVESQLRQTKQEREDIRIKAETDLSQAVAEQQRLRLEVQDLQRKSEISRREAELKAELQASQRAVTEAQREAKLRECLDLDAVKRQEYAQFEDAMRSRLEALRLHLESECQAKDRMNSALTAEVHEKSRLLGVLTEEAAGLRSRERSEAATVDRLESDFERRARASQQEEVASLRCVEYSEREAIAELRAQARIELRAELHDAERIADSEAQSALFRGESLERDRQADLRNEYLSHTGDTEWRLRAMYDDEVRSATASKRDMMQQAEMREKELLNELRQAREHRRDMEISHDAQTAALQVTAAKEKELSAEHLERLRGELHSELRDQHQSSEQHWQQLLDSSERAAERAAERRERSAHEDLHAELRRLRQQLNMVAQCRQDGIDISGGSAWWSSVMESVGGHEAILEMKRKLEELSSLCRQQEETERALKLELSDYKAHGSNKFASSENVLRASLRSELADAKRNCHHEADVASRAMSRSSALEQQLQGLKVDNTNLRDRIKHLEVELGLGASHAAGLEEARAGERFALQELKRSEEKRQRDLVSMDALINETRQLASSLTEHQHLADGLNQMIKKHEAAITPRGSPRGSPRATTPIGSGSSLPYRARTTSPPGAAARESMSSFSTRLSGRLSAMSPPFGRELPIGSSRLLERFSASRPLSSRDLATGSSRPSDMPWAPSLLTTHTELPSGSSRITGRASAISPISSRRDFTSGGLQITSPVASLKELPSSISRPLEWNSALSPLLSSKELAAGSVARQATRPLPIASLASADLLSDNALRMKELDASLRSADTVLAGSSASRELTSTSLSSTVAPLDDALSKRPHSSVQSASSSTTSRTSPARGIAREKESLADRRVRESHQACSSAMASQPVIGSAQGSMFRSSSAAALERMRHSQSPIFHMSRGSEPSLLTGAEASSSKDGKRVSWGSPTPLAGPASTSHSRRKLFH